jgi:monoamine oxidase
VLVTFGFGEQGKALEQMSEGELMADVTAAMKKVFGASATAPRKHFLTRWNSDPYAQGAYSFAAVGGGYQEHVTLAAPVERLRFAGEHTHEKYRATVHGAYLSGIREAERIISGQ